MPEIRVADLNASLEMFRDVSRCFEMFRDIYLKFASLTLMLLLTAWFSGTSGAGAEHPEDGLLLKDTGIKMCSRQTIALASCKGKCGLAWHRAWLRTASSSRISKGGQQSVLLVDLPLTYLNLDVIGRGYFYGRVDLYILYY
eukprot:SAG31_NODE_8408_length_1457_cov_1.553756_1_plen_142_part_00